MKLSFESNLSYQQEAVQSVVGLFEGQTAEESAFLYNINFNLIGFSPENRAAGGAQSYQLRIVPAE